MRWFQGLRPDTDSEANVKVHLGIEPYPQSRIKLVINDPGVREDDIFLDQEQAKQIGIELLKIVFGPRVSMLLQAFIPGRN